MDTIDVSEKLSAALAAKLAMQMSISSLPVVEEWMDTPLTRWLDSIPLPMEMPDGESPAILVSLGSDGRLVRWSSGGVPEGIVPKMVDYLRRAGAIPADFQRVDEIGQALEPVEVGSWIEVQPGSVATGWYFEDTMSLARLRELLLEGEWMAELGDASCTRVARGVGADPPTDVTVAIDAADRIAAASALCTRFGFALDDAAIRALRGDLEFGVRVRRGAVESVRLRGAAPGAQAIAAVCAAAGVALVPAIQIVERSIAAREAAVVELERSAAGMAVVISFLAGAAGLPGSSAN